MKFFQSSLTFIFVIVTMFPLHNQQLSNTYISSRIANYQIRVQLDTEEKSLRASQILDWRNDSKSAIYELWFHLYMNGFRNKSSSFLASMPERWLNLIDEEDLGAIDISRFTVDGGKNLLDQIQYIQPDDVNLNDSSLIRIPLSNPVKPGETVQIEIDFMVQLPRIIARTGYRENFFMLGQWFPKIAVFEDGQWNGHQFFRRSEFFADFGVYEIEITLPKEFVVGATGLLLKEDMKDSLKTLHFRAEDVHDFAITAWPDYKKVEREVNGINVILLHAPEHSGKVDRYFDIIEASLNYTSGWLMPYPYRQLTLVDVPLYAFRAGGMEYPALISCVSFWGIPSSIRMVLEEYTVHEFAHQYFYGILASNESEEPWLDEGFTSWATQKILSHKYGLNQSASTFLNVLVGAHDGRKKSYMKRPDKCITMKPSWQFKPWTYDVSTYTKPMLTLQTLENYLGSSLMDSIMTAYIERWKFKHPRTEDFIDVVQEYAPRDMQWLFQQALYDSSVLDYSVETIQHKWENSGSFKGSDITICRLGEFVFPVEIEYTFEDGRTVITEWDGVDSVYILSVPGPETVVSARVDPWQKIWLDVNWTNNSYTVDDNPVAFIRHNLKSLKFYQQILLALFAF